MLLHRIKPKIFYLNTAIRNITKPKDNVMAIVDYQKETGSDTFDSINYEKNSNNDQNNEEYYDISSEIDEFDTKSINVRSFNPNWKTLNNPGIYSIVFKTDASGDEIPIYKYGNAFAFLPLSNELIYAATIYMQINQAYSQGNIFSVTKENITNATFVFNSQTRNIVGQGVDPPNNINFTINSNVNKIYAIAKDEANNIYIGGSFFINNNDGTSTGIRGFAKWAPAPTLEEPDRWKWSSVGNFNLQSGGTVYSIVVIDQNNIYVGGYFGFIDDNDHIGSKSSSFAKWDGYVWHRQLLTLTDSAGNPASVYAMKHDAQYIYIGGDIYQAKTTGSFIRLNNILRFDHENISFELLGRATRNGTSGPVYAMDIQPGTALYVGGNFISVTDASGNYTVNRLARWNIKKETIGGRDYNANRWSIIQRSTSANITTTQFPGIVTNRTNGNRGVPSVIYTIAVNKNIVWIGGSFQEIVTTKRVNNINQKTTTVSWASKFVSSFDINNNYKTTLWTARSFNTPTL